MKILGVDPSLRSTGYGLIRVRGNQFSALAFGCIKNSPKLLPSRCLARISDEFSALISKQKPDVLAVEGLVYVQNTRTALSLGQVRGAILAVAAQNGLEIFEYAPRKVKMAVVGLGGAAKHQVGAMVKMLLHLRETPQEDAADALAVAICHAHNARAFNGAKPI
jgi:crossover junction endodeoxyribonuclease RuvC